MDGFFRLTQIRMRAIVIGIVTISLIISLTLFFMWRWVTHRVEGIVSDQFNQQQLMLARKIAENVEVYFDLLENELLSYEHFFDIEGGIPNHFRAYLNYHFQYLKKFGILEIRTYDAAGRVTEVYNEQRSYSPEIKELRADYLKWAQDPHNRERIYLTTTYVWQGKPWPGRKVMSIFAPLRLQAEAGTRGNNEAFKGVIEITFDPFYICKMSTEGVKSGQTGYAWIIDQDGTFLAHYEPTFIGKDAIGVREERNIQMSFARIQEIQEQRLLKGEEGMDWYESGWHREQWGRMKKLLAYTPIRFTRGLIRNVLDVENSDRNIWGVGVAAPYAEVNGLIQSFQTQQGLLVGFFFLLIIGVGGTMVTVAYSWNKALTLEVDLKTEALRQSHERLLRSERFAAVGEAAAYVSHEIKNPLMVIGGFANQLERNPQVPEAAKEKLHIISSEVKRLETFLGELRDFTRPAAPAKKETDLNMIVTEVQAMMAETAQETDIRLVTQLEQGMQPVTLDPNQMKQVLINLVKNAMEAMDRGGEIVVATSTYNGRVCLSVSDTGKGIQPEILREIFNPFFTTKKSGTGLGLAVINKIVEDHHGTISVESTMGEGSKFTITLPQTPET